MTVRIRVDLHPLVSDLLGEVGRTMLGEQLASGSQSVLNPAQEVVVDSSLLTPESQSFIFITILGTKATRWQGIEMIWEVGILDALVAVSEKFPKFAALMKGKKYHLAFSFTASDIHSTTL